MTPRSSPPSTTCSPTPGTSTSSTPATSASAPSPTSSATISAPASSPPSATAGASGSAPTRKASAAPRHWNARTVATGTGYIGQYPPELAKVYEDVNTCPDDLLLFMHHVPYTHVLHDGKTVVQYIYDAHYEGAATAQTYAPRWQTLHGLIDDDRYNETLKLLHLSGRPRHRLARRRHPVVPERIQRPRQTRPRRQLPQPHRSRKHDRRRLHPHRRQTLGDRLQQQSRRLQPTHRLHPHHHTRQTRRHLQHHRPVLRLLVRQIPIHPRPQPKPIGTWIADDTLPPARAENQPNGDTSTRITFPNITLKPGDTLTLHGTPDNTEPAPVDYIEITKQ